MAEFSRPITNGTVTVGDDAVVALLAREKVVCTATLVSPRLAVTAGHCLEDPAPSEVFLGSAPPQGGTRIPIAATVRHPQFDQNTLANDVAVVVLAHDSPAVPALMLTSVAGAMTLDQAVRLVGFGVTAPFDAGSRVKRTGAAMIAEIRADSFAHRPAPSQTCFEDSGSPAFVQFDREYFAGIASRGDTSCLRGGVHMRVDAYRDFIDQQVALSEREDSTVEGGCSVSPTTTGESRERHWFESSIVALAVASLRGRSRARGPRRGKEPASSPR